MKTKPYADLLRRLRSSNEYWKRFSLLLFTTDIRRLMKSDSLSGVKLAKRMGVTPPVISSWLRGGENLTIESMSKLAGALDAVVYIHVAKKGVAVRWVEAPEEETIPALEVTTEASGRQIERTFGPVEQQDLLAPSSTASALRQLPH